MAMTRCSTYSVLFGALLLAVPLAVAASQDDDAAHQTGVEAAAPAAGPADGQYVGSGMGGMMEMMTPEMQQMMRSMMSRQGEEAGRPGMMGSDMGSGMMSDGMMSSGLEGVAMMDRGMMYPTRGMGGDMQGMMGTPGILYGMPRGRVAEMTPARVRTFLAQWLAWHDNPRLQIGEIVELDASTITAEIVTLDGSLVQKLAFNRYPGLLRQIDDQ
jgi:hypothetical protein